MVHHSKFLYSALVVSAMAVGANAQVTTSAISGKVLDETKAPVIGATVVGYPRTVRNSLRCSDKRRWTLHHPRYAYRWSLQN